MGFPPSGGGGNLTALFHSQLSGSAASIDTGASGIPASATSLLIVVRARTDQAVVVSAALLRFNGDTGGNYDRGNVTWSGSAVAFGSAYAGTSLAMDSLGSSADANRFHTQQILVADYKDTASFKQAIVSENAIGTALDANVRVGGGGWTWRSTSAINQVTLLPGGGTNLVAGSSLTIYGLA